MHGGFINRLYDLELGPGYTRIPPRHTTAASMLESTRKRAMI